MNCDYMNVTYMDKNYISHLVPESLIEELKYQGQYAMAQGITTGNGEDKIIGAVTFFVDSDPEKNIIMTVRWFYIHPEYRGLGYGRDLYNRLCGLAVDNKVHTVKISLPDIEDAKNLGYVFYEMDFDTAKNGIVEVYTSLGAMMDKTVISDRLKANKTAVSLKAVTDDALKRLINGLAYERRHTAEYILPEEVDDYESDISFVELDSNHSITAALLIRHINEALEPVLFYTKDNKSSASLFRVLSNCVIAAEDKYGRDKSVRLRSTKFTKWDKIGKLFPEIPHLPAIQGSMELVPDEEP